MSLAETVHASAVRFAGRGILVRGASGSGKSALVLQLLFADPEARLVADDRVALSIDTGRLVATVPEALAGLLEVRGQGIIRRPYLSPAPVDLVVDLRPLAECPRQPEPADEGAAILGIDLPRLILPCGAPDGVVRLRVALERLSAASI
jgi:serine kinase of HPr protein (carbohydrate metabolism regulator)